MHGAQKVFKERSKVKSVSFEPISVCFYLGGRKDVLMYVKYNSVIFVFLGAQNFGGKLKLIFLSAVSLPLALLRI